MKKIKLEDFHLEHEDLLSRDDLKKIFGGLSGSPIGSAIILCTVTFSGSWPPVGSLYRYDFGCNREMDSCNTEAIERCESSAAFYGGKCESVSCSY
ncbi:hypothetical protein SAMN04488128_10226 [Chitinophaga eiseniae]|uniref:Uncharacterized protein n=1 Tax=Chitinophaga eiseniae TaxID=634771 RepID=A0A1T4PVF3_9BACT|nr:hypothetical protein [Chitinophaga eiseniae]SJZ95544.1 hypothetical protein SAMN04488128_10226 [Chitinophaga eiseniae]